MDKSKLSASDVEGIVLGPKERAIAERLGLFKMIGRNCKHCGAYNCFEDDGKARCRKCDKRLTPLKPGEKING